MPESSRSAPLPVFLSYARSASRAHAVAVHEALAKHGIEAFLDTEEIETGDNFPERLVDALLGARVVVIFADEEYFRRWYCLLEFRVARAPFLHVVERPGSTDAEREEALAPLLLVLPPDGRPADLERFPPLARATDWPTADDPGAVAALVRKRLDASTLTVGAWLDRTAGEEKFRLELLEADRLPRPLRIGTVPVAPTVGLPDSIGERFVGRADELWWIHDVLTTRRGGLASAAGLAGALEAGGGYGKTRLALEYLHRFGPKHYPGGLFWIDAERDIEEQQFEIIHALDPSVPGIQQLREAPGGIAGRLAQVLRRSPAEAPLLVVLDNVPEPENDTPPRPLESWIPTPGEVALLVTSRSRVSLGARGQVFPLSVNVLKPEAAVALLTRDVDTRVLTDPEWRRIAKWVDHLPLALELLNKTLVSRSIEPKQLLGHATTTAPTTPLLTAAMSALRSVVPKEALRGVAEAFSISYDRLTSQEQHAARLLAYMAPEPIPVALLDAFPPKVFTPAVRAKLIARSFITEVRSDGVPLFGTMHRVLSDYLRTTSPADVRLSFTRRLIKLLGSRTLLPKGGEIGSVGSVLLQVMEFENCRNPVLWPLLNPVLPHAEYAFLQWAKTTDSQLTSAIRLGLSCGILLHSQGSFTRAAGLCRAVLDICLALGEEHPDTLTSMNNLAETHRAQGELGEARVLQEKVLEVSRRVLGEEHPDTLVSMNNLAETYRAQGDIGEARVLQEKVLAVRRCVLGEEHPDTLVSMNNLASTYRAQGDLGEARVLHEKVLEVSRRVLGEGHTSTTNIAQNFCDTLLQLKDVDSARELFAANLNWLIDRDPATLSADQRKVREWVCSRMQVLDPDDEVATGESEVA